jgi:hypothetical protein
MSLSVLENSLKVTSYNTCDFMVLARSNGSLKDLKVAFKFQAPKKPNDFNACKLVSLVTLRETRTLTSCVPLEQGGWHLVPNRQVRKRMTGQNVQIVGEALACERDIKPKYHMTIAR